MKIDKKLINIIRDIKSVKIQGATAVARVSLLALSSYILSYPKKSGLKKLLLAVSEKISQARPAEPMARNLLKYYADIIFENYRNGLLQPSLIKVSVNNILALVTEAKKKIAWHGSNLIKNSEIIFTHCHSSLTESILKLAWQQGKKFKVFHTETRPLYQGHITDRNLRKFGIPSTLVVDSAAAYLISSWSGDDINIDKVILGADSIEPDGSVFNKVGSFGIALAAATSSIPVYIAATLLKYDQDAKSKNEIRDGKELWPQAPKDSRVINYAFDKIPTDLITGFITEVGIIKPKQIKNKALKTYPQIFKK
ncbi:MAG: translation initiation factor eIF-2B [Patescibacteria group bacterium]